MEIRLNVAICALSSLVCGMAMAVDVNWPQFRGPGARGVAENPALPDRWSATENVAWKTDIPGRGWSSPIVWGNRVFLTTAVSQEQLESPKKGLYLGGNRPEPPKSLMEWWVYCLDLGSGKVLWKQMVHRGQPQGAIHVKNSFASETPVTDGQRVYCLFGNLGLFTFDMDGKLVWSRRLEPHTTRFGWGTAASPVLHKGRLYVADDNDQRSTLSAFDAKSGQVIWQVDRDEKSNWSTPFIWENRHRTEIVTLGSGKVRAYDLDGKLLWWLAGMSDITIATPFADGDLLYISSGYVGSRKRPIYAIRAGAEGDISLKQDATSGPSIAWCNWQAAPYNPSTLLYQGRLYVLYDRGMLSCFDAATGKPLYQQQRIEGGRGFTASPWANSGKIFCFDEDGVTHVLRAGEKFESLHANRLADDDMGMATPAIAGQRLLIRTAARVYCVRGK